MFRRLAPITATACLMIVLAGCRPAEPVTAPVSPAPAPSTTASAPPTVPVPTPSATPSAPASEPPAPAPPPSSTPPVEEGSSPGAGEPGPPRVFMAIHGSNQLANDDALDPQWEFVRQNLDGLWGNTADVSEDEQTRLFTKVANRNVITEVGLNPDLATWGAVANYDRIEEDNPDLKINREAIAFYTDDPTRWDGRTVAAAREEFVTNPETPEAQRYDAIYTGWNAGNWGPYNPMTPSADAAVADADGMFVECGNDDCLEAPVPSNGQWIRTAIEKAHAANEPFVWFTAPDSSKPTGWLKNFQDTYNAFRAEGLWRENDIVMVINYHGKYPAVPETTGGEPADTVTGAVYWALRQDW